MANRQIDPHSAYIMGAADGTIGSARRSFTDPATQRDYDNGFNAARLAERSPL